MMSSHQLTTAAPDTPEGNPAIPQQCKRTSHYYKPESHDFSVALSMHQHTSSSVPGDQVALLQERCHQIGCHLSHPTRELLTETDCMPSLSPSWDHYTHILDSPGSWLVLYVEIRYLE